MLPSHQDLIPFEPAHLPVVRPWFDDPEVQRWLAGPDWPETILHLQETFHPGETFRGRVVLLQRSFVLLDGQSSPRALITGDLYDRRTRYAGEGPDGPRFVDASGPHRPAVGLAVVVDPGRRREGWATRAINDFMTHPDLANAEVFEVGIEPDNLPSRRLFEQLGFVLENDEPDWEDMVNYMKTVNHSRR